MTYEFGPFRLDEDTRVLSRHGAAVSLWPKSFDTLTVLVKSGGAILTKDALLRQVWPETSVEENSLAKAISDIRRALDEGPKDRRYIVTVPRYGYRFIAPVASIAAAGAGGAAGAAAAAAMSGRRWTDAPAIAVLPFTVLLSQPGDVPEHLAIALADSLITRLSRVRQIVVRPTSAILRFATAPLLHDDPRDAGRTLGVESIVCGTIRCGSVHAPVDRVRVTVQLVSVSSGATLWAESFDEPFTELFALEDAIATRIVDALAVRLTGEEQRSLTRRHTVSREAYELYLKGRFFWSKRTAAASRTAIACFEEAIARDPAYALAYAGLADAHIVLGLQGVVMGGVPPLQALPRAQAAVDRALAIDDTLAEAHTSLGHIRFFFDFDWPGAERAFRRALALNPHYAPAHHVYALALIGMERADDALASIERARRLDPLSLIVNVNVGRVLYHARRYDEALAHLLATRDMDPRFAATYHRLGLVFEATGRFDAAIDAFETVARLSDDGPLATASIAYVHAIAGRTARAEDLLSQLLALACESRQLPGSARERHGDGESDSAGATYIAAPHIAEIYAALGRDEDALAWLERGVSERASALALLRVNPRFDRLRANPRFAHLRQRLGIA